VVTTVPGGSSLRSPTENSQMDQPKITHHMLKWCHLGPVYRIAATGSACRRPAGPSRRLSEEATRGEAAKARLECLWVIY
jgi:hypothetical protein